MPGLAEHTVLVVMPLSPWCGLGTLVLAASWGGVQEGALCSRLPRPCYQGDISILSALGQHTPAPPPPALDCHRGAGHSLGAWREDVSMLGPFFWHQGTSKGGAAGPHCLLLRSCLSEPALLCKRGPSP